MSMRGDLRRDGDSTAWKVDVTILLTTRLFYVWLPWLGMSAGVLEIEDSGIR